MPETTAPAAAADVTTLVVGVLGGTGPQGKGLAYRLAAAGQQVIIGSRDAARADAAAQELNALLGGGVAIGARPAELAAGVSERTSGATAGRPDTAGAAQDASAVQVAGVGAAEIAGADNAGAAAKADIVIVAVPWDGHAALLESLRPQLAGKIVVDCVNPLGFDKQGAYALTVPEGSAAQQAAALLPDSRVTAAFHHVSAVLLTDPAVATIDTDVLVLGDDRPATDVVAALAGRIPGMRGVYAGRLRTAHQVEALTANLIAVNRRYKAHAGIRVTDI
jgi:NADPH-dependent F420 reductase